MIMDDSNCPECNVVPEYDKSLGYFFYPVCDLQSEPLGGNDINYATDFWNEMVEEIMMKRRNK